MSGRASSALDKADKGHVSPLVSIMESSHLSGSNAGDLAICPTGFFSFIYTIDKHTSIYKHTQGDYS